MGKRWVDLYNLTAIYESDVINIASDFDYYIAKVNSDYVENGGKVEIYIKVSLDGVNWSDWVDIVQVKKLFDKNSSQLKDAKFQYKVVMSTDQLLGEGEISPVFNSFKIDFTGSFRIVNYGDTICKPELWIKKTNGSGDVRLTNETNGMTLEFKDLNNGEEVYVDCDNEDIVTNLPMKYRYNSHNDVFIELEVGDNFLSGEGDFTLDLRMQFKTYQG